MGRMAEFECTTWPERHEGNRPKTNQKSRMQTGRQRVVVWGAGGHGKVVVDALLAAAEYDVIGIVDDDPGKTGAMILGVRVLDFSDGLAELVRRTEFDCMIVGIGDNYIRAEKFQEFLDLGVKPVTVVHPAAHVSRFAKLGQGVVVMAGAVINPGTVVEDNAVVNTSASVDHDNRLEYSCHVLPNVTLAGGVRIGEYAYVGSGAVVIPNVTVHKYSYLGAGAVAIKDVPEGVVSAGNPAAQIRLQEKRPNQQKWTQCLSKR